MKSPTAAAIPPAAARPAAATPVARPVAARQAPPKSGGMPLAPILVGLWCAAVGLLALALF